MQVEEAIKKAFEILTEEQVRPTMKYGAAVNDIFGTTAVMTLMMGRRDRPRAVQEDPTLCRLQGTNFELLLAIYSQVSESDRPQFIEKILECVRKPIRAHKNRTAHFPNYDGQVSALAIIVEFCVRTGYLKECLEATKQPQFPTASLVIMLMEVEEMVAANFNLFSDSELSLVPDELTTLREIAERQTYSAGGPHNGPTVKNPHYIPGYKDKGEQIVKIIDGIREECRQARYWYLKGALQNRPNLEIEADVLKIESYISKLGFGDDMIKVLNAAEASYKDATTPFELKNSFTHLRGFLEHLHRTAAKATAKITGVSLPKDNWGTATIYLRQHGFFTVQHEAYVTSLYTLISDTSVHPLGADREYARLLRTMVIEYGVMFLSMLDGKGVKI